MRLINDVLRENQTISPQPSHRDVTSDKPVLGFAGSTRPIWLPIKNGIVSPEFSEFFMELLETIAKVKSDDDEVEVHLVTVEDEFKGEQQKQYLMQIQESVWATGIKFSWEFDESNSIHARHIITDNGWKILLDSGLDIFQHYDMNQTFSINTDCRNIDPARLLRLPFYGRRD